MMNMVINMEIDKIKKNKNGKYTILLKDNEKITTYDDVILKNGLLFQKNIDSALRNQVNLDTKYYDNYYKAVRYIERKRRSIWEMNEYFAKLECLPEETETIIKQLTQIGLLNDLQFAKAFASDRFHLSTAGPGKIRRELEEYHLDSEFIEQSLMQLAEEEVISKLKKIIEKKIKNNTKYSKLILKQKLMSECSNLGYQRDMIISCFDQFSFENNNVQAEYEKIKTKLEKKYSGSELNLRIRQKLYQKGYQMEDIQK